MKIKELYENAIRVASIKHPDMPEPDRLVLDQDGYLEFEVDNYCGGGFYDTDYFSLDEEDLFKDDQTLKQEHEDYLEAIEKAKIEEHRKEEQEKKIKAEKRRQNKEKRDREEYERLKKKYEDA